MGELSAYYWVYNDKDHEHGTHAHELGPHLTYAHLEGYIWFIVKWNIDIDQNPWNSSFDEIETLTWKRQFIAEQNNFIWFSDQTCSEDEPIMKEQ